MRFASPGLMSKYDYARTLAASLAWILIRQRDAVGLTVFDERVSEAVPPRSTNIQLKAILSCLDRTEPSRATFCGEAIHQVARSIRKRGLCVVISDLFDEPASVISGLHHLRYKQQDVVVLWLQDPLERGFRKEGPLKVRDLESGEEVVVDGGTAGRYHRRGIAAHREAIERACRDRAIDCEVIGTDEPFAKALLRILEKRRRLF
jgi:uncharacterized protein (DUF58 family)